jgi:hypothetical protein
VTSLPMFIPHSGGLRGAAGALAKPLGTPRHPSGGAENRPRPHVCKLAHTRAPPLPQVRVADITAFGSLAAVGEKLLDAERKKDGYLSVEMVSTSTRTSGAATLWVLA